MGYRWWGGSEGRVDRGVAPDVSSITPQSFPFTKGPTALLLDGTIIIIIIFRTAFTSGLPQRPGNWTLLETFGYRVPRTNAIIIA